MKKILRMTGLISIIGPTVFLLIVLILGLVQPGYNHFVDTMSVLALGKWGWIQDINFLILAITIVSFGIGLSTIFEKKIVSSISIIFSIITVCVIAFIFFPTDAVDRTRIQLTEFNSFHGIIHLFITMVIIGFAIPLLISIRNKMKKNIQFSHLIRYTTISFVINIVVGILWYIFRRYGILFAWKGLWEKMIALNILTWIGIVGLKLVRD